MKVHLHAAGPESELFGRFCNGAEGRLVVVRFVFQSQRLKRNIFPVMSGYAAQAFQGRILVELGRVLGVGGERIVTHGYGQDWLTEDCTLLSAYQTL
jgi:hypothetical protein